MMKFGSKLKKLRQEKNISQRELADILEISSSAVGMYESNKRIPNYPILKKISDYFGVSADDLLGLNDATFPIKMELPFIIDKDGKWVSTDKFDKQMKARELFLIRSGIYEAYDKNSKLFYDWRNNYNQVVDLINKNIKTSIELINQLDTKYIVFDKEYYTKLLDDFIWDFKSVEDNANIFIEDLENIDINNFSSFENTLEYKKNVLSERYTNKDLSNITEEEINLLYDFLIEEKKYK